MPLLGMSFGDIKAIFWDKLNLPNFFQKKTMSEPALVEFALIRTGTIKRHFSVDERNLTALLYQEQSRRYRPRETKEA